MWDTLFKAAAAAVAAIFVNEAVKELTGKSAVEHAFGAWCSLRDSVNEWLNEHPDMIGQPLFAKILRFVDKQARRLARVSIGVRDTAESSVTTIVEEEISEEELEQLCPDLHLTENWQEVVVEQPA